MSTFRVLLKTEMRLSLRGMDMLIFAIFMPIVVIVFIGMIYGNKLAFEGASYTFVEQSFGAIITISICAGGVMGLPLVVSDYRNKKILKRFKVTPISPALILLVQVTIYMLYSIASLILVYLVGAIFWGFQLQGSWIQFIGAYFLVMSSMFSIGLLVGGLAPNMKIASVAASLLYFPMLIFSGATLPYEIMPHPLQKIAGILPLTQGIKLLKAISLGLPVESSLIPITIIIVNAIICLIISIRFFKWE